MDFHELLGDRQEYGIRQPIEHGKATLIGWSIFGVLLTLSYLIPETNQFLVRLYFNIKVKYCNFMLSD